MSRMKVNPWMRKVDKAERIVQYGWLALLSLSLIFFFTSGCISRPTASQAITRKEIKDVNLRARDEDATPKNRLLVLPFLDQSLKRPVSLREQARKEFIKSLNSTHAFVVLGSEDLKLDETSFIYKDEYKMTEVSEKAKQLGVSAFLEGKIMDLSLRRKSDEIGLLRQMKSQFDATVRIRIFSARSGKELFNTQKTIELEESHLRVAENIDSDAYIMNNPEIFENLLIEAFLQFTPQIKETMNRMSWEGRIALINGDRVFLNVGRMSGLQIGDILKVSDEGEEVYDPQTGNYIGHVPGRHKGTLEVSSYFGQDGSIATIHSGAGFKENDRVEIY